jgi:hypothetical protein
MAAGWVPVSCASFVFDTPDVVRASSSERMKASTESIPFRASRWSDANARSFILAEK